MTPAPTTQMRSIMLWHEYPAPVTCQSMPGELAELGVRDEALLLRAQTLHGGEHLGVALLGELEPELLGFEPDRVEAALLAQHDPALRADELRRVRLDRRRVVELAGDRAALAREEIVPGDRRPRRELVARAVADERRELADLREVEPRGDPVERLERESDFEQVGVAGPLPHPVHR